jgi:hypothetical protein
MAYHHHTGLLTAIKNAIKKCHSNNYTDGVNK